MNLIVKMQFGSHVYGTNIPSSDLDFKAVYLPEGRDILLQKVKQTIQFKTKKDGTQKNTSDDIDIETFSVQQFLKLLLEGQTVTLDMLFTPQKFYLEQSPYWELIIHNKDRFIHSGVSSFAGYCRQQAAKYGIKGSRIAAVRKTIDLIKTFSLPYDRLEKYIDKINELVAQKDEFINLVDIETKTFRGKETYLEVCNRKIPLTATVRHGLEIFQKLLDAYGQRALLAEKNEGIDWKALMHAVRVCNEAKELLQTGVITQPRPEAQLLLQIRTGQLPYKQVAEMIEDGLKGLEEISKTSKLRKEPDYNFAEELVLMMYKGKIQ